MEGRKKESYTQQNAIAAPRRSVTAGRGTDHTQRIAIYCY